MQHLVVPDMADEDPIVATPIDTSPGNTSAPPPPPPPGNGSSWSGQKTLAVALGVGGLVGVTVGSIFGLKTMLGSCNDGKNGVDGGTYCSSNDRNAASTEGAISTIGFIAGGALLAGAVVVWILAPSGSAKTGALVNPSIRASAGPSWAGLQGTF
jgi:hypothetical protein